MSDSSEVGDNSDDFYRHHPSFLRLFRREFDVLLDDPEFLAKFKRKLDRYLPDLYDEIQELAEERDFDLNVNPPKSCLDVTAKHQYFYALRQISGEYSKFWGWFQTQLVQYVKSTGDGWLYAMLKAKPAPEIEEDIEVQHFDKFFVSDTPRLLDHVVDIVRVEHCIRHLHLLNVPEYEGRVLQVNVEPVFEHYDHDHHYGACELMRRMFYARPGVLLNKQHSWYYDLMYVLSKHPTNRPLLAYIDQDYKKPLAKYVAYLRTNIKELIMANVEDFIDPAAQFSTAFRAQSHDYMVCDVEFETEDSEHVALRGYQKELVRHANTGLNTLICAPTGAGKTVVAVDIILTHFFRLNIPIDGLMKQNARVVFVVPSVPLVEQQTKLIQRFLGVTMQASGFHGGDGRNANSRLADILRAHVVVTTPQLLLNMLTSVFRTERLYISDFTLAVFDECHHCGANNHPYNMLMQMVRTYQIKTSGNPNAQPAPQIVGLTASLGAGKSAYMDPRVTEEHMLRLCVRMTAKQISTVHTPEGLAELEQFVNPPVDAIESVTRSTDNDFYNLIVECVKSAADVVRVYIAIVRNTVDELNEFRLPEKVDVQYINSVERLYESSARWPESLIQYKLLIVTVIDNLRIYLHTIRMNDLLPARYAEDYLQKQMVKFGEWFQSPDCGEEEKELGDQLMEIYRSRKEMLMDTAKRDSGAKKEILRTLVRILDEEYTKNPETRTMIFVEQRATTHALAQFLIHSTTMSKHFNALSVRALTSTNQSSKLGGMSNWVQKLIIENFSTGVVKALVVTSVAEEGMDISACNLIIKYNVVGSERTLIQRRGRARALNSRSVLLALDGDVERREVDNIARERIMHVCLKNLQSKSDQHLHDLICAMTTSVEAEENLEAEQRAQALRQLASHVYDVKCSQCDTTFFESGELRVINNTYFICIQPMVWSKVSMGFKTSPKGISEVNVAASCSSFRCKKCGRDLGSVINFSSIFLPAFSCKQLTFTEKKGRTETRSHITWKYVIESMFPIPECSQQNLLDMAPSLQNASNEDYQNMREQHALALHLQIEAIKRRRQRKNRYDFAEFDVTD